jgi:hypothetical protein
MILLFSHKLTESQKRDAVDSLGVKEFLNLPEELQKIWSQVPAELETLSQFLKPIEKWLEEILKVGDYVLISGDFGATYNMIEFVKNRKGVAIYSTNRRVAEEIHDGDRVKVSHTFQHVRYRYY